jgi:hypothetical protein
MSEQVTIRIEGGTLTGSPEAIAEWQRSKREQRDREQPWPKTDKGYVDTYAAMTTLARMFPTLRDAPGVDPWDATEFLRWTCTGGLSSGMLHAARFMLSVWNPRVDWNEVAHEEGILEGDEKLSPFNLHDALGCWDYEHRDAFASWVRGAFWP